MNHKFWNIITLEKVSCPPYRCLVVPVDIYEAMEEMLEDGWRYVNRQLADRGIDNFYFPKMIKAPPAPDEA